MVSTLLTVSGDGCDCNGFGERFQITEGDGDRLGTRPQQTVAILDIMLHPVASGQQPFATLREFGAHLIGEFGHDILLDGDDWADLFFLGLDPFTDEGRSLFLGLVLLFKPRMIMCIGIGFTV